MASIMTNLRLSLLGIGMSLRADADTICWMIEHVWKDSYDDGWWSAKDGTRFQIVIDGSVPLCELHLYDHHGERTHIWTATKMKKAMKVRSTSTKRKKSRR